MKSKGMFSKLVIMVIVLANIIYTAAVLYVFLKTSCEPTVLTGCWFAFTTGELWLLSGIKREKLRRGNDEGLH